MLEIVLKNWNPEGVGNNYGISFIGITIEFKMELLEFLELLENSGIK